MDLRKELIERLESGERLADLCREFGISRKTGDKFRARYKALGIAGLEDQSRAPNSIPHKTSAVLMDAAIELRKKHPTWGPKKLKQVLEEQLGRRMPSTTTIGVALSKAGLVTPRKRVRRAPHQPTKLVEAHAANDVWCIDYKGQFRLGDRSYCYPLTLTDHFSRFVLACEAMPRISDSDARAVCLDVFRTWGLPSAIRSDNGTPFASTGLAGLTRLSALFVRLGIALQRIRPAHPEENGRHERMHRTLKAETTRPAKANLLQQQERFDSWVHEFNHARPHEALDMKRPVDVFAASTRTLPAVLPELSYPLHDDVLRVSRSGHIKLPRRSPIYLSAALGGENVGIREEDDRRWLISYADLDLALVDNELKELPVKLES